MKKKSPLKFPAVFAQNLADWFAIHGRDYPWRRTVDPYAILVSEIMLQQTQITTVLERGYYERWMKLFPDFTTLANASESAALKAWEGLGYYRRARNLHKLAFTIVAEHGGVFPREIEAIRALPGIGPYTAGAVASFAFDDRQAVVDGNVTRVLSRLFDDTTPVDSTRGHSLCWERAEKLIGKAESPRIHNSALMELGQTLCRTSEANCERCPVASFCATSDPLSLPVKEKRATITAVTERVFFLRTKSGVLLEQEKGPRRTGLWKLPVLPEMKKLPKTLHSSAYTITRYRVTLHVHAAGTKISTAPPLHHSIIPIRELAHLPMPSPYRRALNAVMTAQESSVIPSSLG
jgi:A/G-specific adenine glycosylase